MREDTPLILLVESDESLGRIVASYLYHDGYRVLRFASLADAVAAVRTLNSERSTLDARRSEFSVERRVEGAAPALVLLDLDSLEADEMMDLAHLTGQQAIDSSAEEAPCGLSELMAFPLLLFAGDRFPTWWARRDDAPVLYKPFAIHELRRQVGSTLAMTEVDDRHG